MLPVSSGHWFPSLRRYEPDQVQGSGRMPTLSPIQGPPRNDSNLCFGAILVNPSPERVDSEERFFRFGRRPLSRRKSLTVCRGFETRFRRKTHQLSQEAPFGDPALRLGCG
ncbi:protein of unknown function [Methylorubrum extorquens]|uniref:Uncharacterized protein n=1 Tax=Methylorubrum extorquens TaxID=408 RepID=A0A2N9AUI9_METEX|nr:protein of unknown function [Methylorubrum extorquens]